MTKRIRLKKNTTWKQRQAAWRARQRGYQRTIRELRIQVALMTRKLDEQADEIEAFEAERAKVLDQRYREQARNWRLYDRAYAETSEQEKALFEASPAYQKYQQWRQTR